MTESQNAEERTELTTEQLVQIANQLQSQNRQMDAMIKDLGTKIAQKEVENSQLKAIVESIRPQPAPATEEE